MSTLLIRQKLSLWIFPLALFTSSFLIFWVELFSAKRLLPTFGGTPATWIVCLLFFQLLLLGGYCYARLISQLESRLQPNLQLLVLGFGFLFLPFREFDINTQGHNPVLLILMLLLRDYGVVFLGLSASTPLLQGWFTRIQQSQGANTYNPFVLYAASNLGALCSLIAYPLWIEPSIGLREQSKIWLAGYICMFFVTLACGYLYRSCILRKETPFKVESASTWQQRLTWLFFSMVPSSLLSGTTTIVSVEIAPFPMLWAFFLGIYLVTLILVFAPKPQYLPGSISACLGIFAALSLAISGSGVGLQVTMICFFLLVWACHTQLAKKQPVNGSANDFYLWTAAGGLSGAFINAIAAPILLNDYWEYDVMLLLALVCGTQAFQHWRKVKWIGIGLSLVVIIQSVTNHSEWAVLHRERNFFGVYRIHQSQKQNLRVLIHGETLHGMQSLNPNEEKTATAYYHTEGPVGDFLLNEKVKSPVAIIGLGSGTLLSYSRPGEIWDLYEIDPLVVRLSKEWFSFIKHSPAQINTYIGDARAMLRQSPRKYQTIMFDAFTSDSIPQHLLTKEAIEEAIAHLESKGILAYHISNRFVNLTSVLNSAAKSLNLAIYERKDIQGNRLKYPSQWVVLSPNHELQLSTSWQVPKEKLASHPWSDNLSSIVPTLRAQKKNGNQTNL